MSRIGRLPVPIPAGVTVAVEADNHVRVQGPNGVLERDLPAEMLVEVNDGRVLVARPGDAPKLRSLHGLTRTLVANMVTGVGEGFTKTLEIQGVGYRAQLQGANVTMQLGFSHPVVLEPPAGISFVVEANRLHVRGIDKELVGQTAANIRALRPPEPYNGKGVRYLGEKVRRKAGKAGKGAGRR